MPKQVCQRCFPIINMIEPVGNLMGLQGALDELGVWEMVFHK